MALKKLEVVNLKIVGNLNVNCYIKVNSISGGKDGLLAQVLFTKDSSSGEFVKSSEHAFTPNLDGQNFIAQAYNYLKTLPEFAGATDC